jgi:hypothetical protein
MVLVPKRFSTLFNLDPMAMFNGANLEKDKFHVCVGGWVMVEGDPTAEELAQKVFNLSNSGEICHLQCRSISVGDIVVTERGAAVCMDWGWKVLTKNELVAFYYRCSNAAICIGEDHLGTAHGTA